MAIWPTLVSFEKDFGHTEYLVTLVTIIRNGHMGAAEDRRACDKLAGPINPLINTGLVIGRRLR